LLLFFSVSFLTILLLLASKTNHFSLDLVKGYFHSKNAENSKRDRPKIYVKYGDRFGNIDIKTETEFVFPDFKLILKYYRELTILEEFKRYKSNLSGLDGGYSMMTPPHGFEVEDNKGQITDTFELMHLPYSRNIFYVNGLFFDIYLDESAWVVEKSKKQSLEK